jgi:5-methylcytosine-specific restriction endonuclease McrA
MTNPIISPDTTQLKQCSRCHEWKPSTLFGKETKRGDGLQSQCKACAAEYKAAHYAANADHKKQYNIEYRQANAEKLAEYRRKYTQSPAAQSINRARSLRRRARMQGADGTFSADELAAIREAQTDNRGRLICWRCGKPIKGTPHLDHWIPVAKGGTNSAGNLHYMHARCNLSKGAKMPTEIGRLI